MDSVEDLYKNFGILADAKDNAGSHVEAFEVILSGVKGGTNAKRLASQFIARFLKYFPDLTEKALDALFDLCEDDDVNIRKQAIKDVTSVCRANKHQLPKVADVLVQLLQTEDSSELSLVQSALVTLLEIDLKGALGGLFSQILSADESIREKAVKFMAVKLKNVPTEKWTADLESYFVEETKKVLADCTGDEFVVFMKLLSGLEHMKTLQGRTQLIEIVAEQSEMDKDFEASEPDNVDRLLQCFRQALPYFSKNVHSDKFVSYMVGHVIPVLGSLLSGAQAEEGADVQLEILRLLAELCTHCGNSTRPQVQTVFNKLLEYMPEPPTDPVAAEKAEPDFSFSHIECLMYAFHQLARHHPGVLTDEDNAETLKDFRHRLQFLARGVQVYIKQLRTALQGKQGPDLNTEENKIRVLALKTTNNINTLIKDLFHNPPSFKATITLSWKPVKQSVTPSETVVSPGQKRSAITPITFDNGTNIKKQPPQQQQQHQRQDRATYAPPQGKFSEKAGDFPATWRGGWWRGRGGQSRGGESRGVGGYGRGRGGRGGQRGGFRRW